MAIVLFLLAWALLASIFLAGWARLRATERRATEAIDEALTARGPADPPLAEAA